MQSGGPNLGVFAVTKEQQGDLALGLISQIHDIALQSGDRDRHQPQRHLHHEEVGKILVLGISNQIPQRRDLSRPDLRPRDFILGLKLLLLLLQHICSSVFTTEGGGWKVERGFMGEVRFVKKERKKTFETIEVSLLKLLFPTDFTGGRQ